MKKSLVIIAGISTFAMISALVLNETDFSLKTITTNALECEHSHVEHHDAVNASIINSGSIEYWCCCNCHKSFSNRELTQIIENTSGSPTDVDDGRYVAALGQEYSINPTINGGVSELPVPSGYAFSQVFTAESSGWNILQNIDISDFSEVSFGVNADHWHIFCDSWDYCGAPDVWSFYKLEQTESGVWDIYQYNSSTSEFVLKVQSRTGSNLQDVFELNGDPGVYNITNLRFVLDFDYVTADGIAAFSALENPTDAKGELTLPSGFKKLSKQVLSNANELNDFGRSFLANVDISQFRRVAFAFRTTNRSYCDSSWGNPLSTDTWYYAIVFNNGDGTYTSSIYDYLGVYKFGYTSNSFRNCFIYANYGGDIPTWYSTEVVGELRTDLETPVGEIISESAINSNGVSITKSDLTSPEGFENVFVTGSQVGERYDAIYFDNKNIEEYEKITFALMSSELYIDGIGLTAPNNQWIFVTLTNNKNHLFNMEFTTNGGQITSWGADVGTTKEFENVDSYFDISPAFIKGALNTIMWKREVYAKSGCVIYTTELRGIKFNGEDPVEPTEYIESVLDESAYSANGCIYTLTDQITAPVGFEKVNNIQINRDGYMHGQAFSSAIITNQSIIKFGLRTSGWLLFENWSKYFDGQDRWVIFTLTNNGDTTFNLVATDENGTTLYETTNLPSYKGSEPGVYTNYALNALLFGNSLEIKPSQKNGVEFTLYATELIGFKEYVAPTGIIIDEYAASANGVTISECSIDAPDGYENVGLWSGTADRHGMQYSASPLSDYSDIHFGMKSDEYIVFNGNYYYGTDWVFLNLTNNKDNTFNLKVYNESGQLIYSEDSMVSYKGADPGVYTNYALNSILYGCPSGIYPHGTNVYVTELRASFYGDLEIVKNSNTDYSIIYQTNNRYIFNADRSENKTAVNILKTNLEEAGSLSNISTVASSSEVFSDSAKYISIGDTSLLRTSGALNGETLDGGYIIKTVGHSIFVYAENPSDYVVAINDLMEMMFGYKFYASTEVVLNHSNNINFSRVDKVVNLSFAERDVILANGSMLASDDRSQLGYDSGYEWTINTSTHGMCGTYLDISSHETDHPNWYSRGNDKWGQAQYQLCYSAHGNSSEYEAMVNQASEEIIYDVLNNYSSELALSNYPSIIIDLSIQDNWYECNCSSCQAEKAKYGSFAGQQLHFVNDVANKTDEWFKSEMPNVEHSYKFLAYQQGQKAPTFIDFSLNENIKVEFAPVYVDITKPIASTGVNAEHYNDICNWIDLLEDNGLSAANMSLWLYSYSVNNMVPLYDYDAFQETYKNMHNLGITKIRTQFKDGPQLTSFQDLNFYLKGQVMQNVDVDLEKATEEFISNYYGSGAEQILKYYNAMINNMKSTYTDDNTIFNDHNNKKYWSKTVVTNLIDLCDEAIESVENSNEDSSRKEVLINRINREKLTAVYMMLEFKYTTIFNKKTYKNFFSSTCSELGITNISASLTVSSWLSSK